MPLLPGRSPNLYVPEQWGAYVDNSDSGLTVYVPASYPYINGFNADGPSPEGTNNMTVFSSFSWYPGAVFEGDIYLIVGPVAEARPIIYELRHEQTAPSRYSPWGFLEEPTSGATISGNGVLVGGWVVGTSPVTDVQVVVDGAAVGIATYGISRPGVVEAMPGQTANAGFEYALDTTKFSNGAHTVTIKATDTNGNIAIFPTCHVSVSNR
jgi:hypothetical protein